MKYECRLVQIAAAIAVATSAPVFADTISGHIHNFSITYKDLNPNDAWRPYQERDFNSGPVGLNDIPRYMSLRHFAPPAGMTPSESEPEFYARYPEDWLPRPLTGAWIDRKMEGARGSPLGLRLEIFPPPGMTTPREYELIVEQGTGYFDSEKFRVAPRTSVTFSADSFIGVALNEGSEAVVRAYLDVWAAPTRQGEYVTWVPEGEPLGVEGAVPDYSDFGEGWWNIKGESVTVAGEGEKAENLEFTYTNDSDQWGLLNVKAGISMTGSVISPVPEPETYALMLAGLGFIVFVRKKFTQS